MSKDAKDKDQAELPWLDALEERTHDAMERLAALGAENRRLAARIEELEAGRDGPAADGDPEAAWRRERDAVRKRIGRLTELLDGLLEAD